MNERETGIVKRFDDRKGYGFGQRDKGGDVFVHYNEIRGDGYRSLFEGQRVEFSVIEGMKGPQAQELSVSDV